MNRTGSLRHPVSGALIKNRSKAQSDNLLMAMKLHCFQGKMNTATNDSWRIIVVVATKSRERQFRHSLTS